MPWRFHFARVVTLLVLLPAGLLCVGVPFYMLTLPDRAAIVDDTRAALGAGTDAGGLKASYVDCTRQRSGSSSSSARSIGITEYDCVIDLASTAPPQDDPFAGRRWQDGMDEWLRRRAAEREALRGKERVGISNRLERTLAIDRSGKLPAVRLLSSPGEPRRIGLVWGFGELAWRWMSWLVISVLFFGFGGFCLFAVKLAWSRSGTRR